MYLIGAIAGDIIGSVYEWHNAKKDVSFFKEGCRFTDDTVLTCAVANWLIEQSELSGDSDDLYNHWLLKKNLKNFAKKYPNAGYGGMFKKWFQGEEQEPMNSFGNGAGMRVSAVPYFCDAPDTVDKWAQASAEVTHNHPEGIKGAQAIANAVWGASRGLTKVEIKDAIEEGFGYDLSKGLDEIGRNAHKFDATCQVTVPEAIIAFLNSEDYEDAIRKAILVGGDSDTIACMTGAIAGAYYGVPDYIVREAMSYLPEDLADVVIKFENFINKKRYAKKEKKETENEQS